MAATEKAVYHHAVIAVTMIALFYDHRSNGFQTPLCQLISSVPTWTATEIAVYHHSVSDHTDSDDHRDNGFTLDQFRPNMGGD